VTAADRVQGVRLGRDATGPAPGRGGEDLARKQKGSLARSVDRRKKAEATFLGKGWCDITWNRTAGLREPVCSRGRSYVGRGGHRYSNQAEGIAALWQRTSTYKVAVAIRSLPAKRGISGAECTGHIDSMVDLLSGTRRQEVLE